MADWELSDGSKVVGSSPEELVVEAIRRGSLDGGLLIREAGSGGEWRPIRTHAPFAMALAQREVAMQPAPQYPPQQPYPPPQPYYPPQYAPPPQQVTVIQEGSESGCMTVLWIVLLVFVVLPVVGLGSCVVVRWISGH